MPDNRKTLGQLYEDWEHCTRCSLGERRVAEKGAFVFGEGTRGGVMFIGEGPGRVEEELGRPFVGPSGDLLRRVIEKVGVTDYYISNIVACRSCAHRLDDNGMPMFRNRRGGRPLPVYVDEPPSPIQMAACMPRIYEEIYLVDPVVIVSLGGTATEALLKRPVTITKIRGTSTPCFVPGATYRPVLTEKKGAWARKLHGVLEMPVEQNEVAYEVIPTIHPAFALRKLEDRRKNNDLDLFVADIRKAVRVYEKYMLEAHGVIPEEGRDTLPETNLLAELMPDDQPEE